MMKNDVKVFKLVCGEEIIASVIERISSSEENNLITLYRPCLLQGIDRSRSPQWILGCHQLEERLPSRELCS